jgi:uncharacterized protein (DUF2236 family)
MASIEVTECIESVRKLIADNIRERVVGPDSSTKAQDLMNAPGPRWFTPDRPIYRVHGDASMFIGGLRAVLFQSLHPLAMAGVAIHSDYKADPWGRLQRTADFLASTSFGTAEVAQAAVNRVLAVHERVTGVASDGRPYSANDPHLLLWVHVAEVDSFLAAYQRYGTTSLDQKDRDGYVADMSVIASALGVPNPPTTEAELRKQLADFRSELKSTKEARDAARYLIIQPPLEFPARAAYSLIAAAAVSLLPAWSRFPLRLPYLPLTEFAVAQPLGDVITRTFRWAIDGDLTAPTTAS